jgi:uncharacterized protein (TIGR03437 family)
MILSRDKPYRLSGAFRAAALCSLCAAGIHAATTWSVSTASDLNHAILVSATGGGVWAGQTIQVHPDGSQTVAPSSSWDDRSQAWVANPLDWGESGERLILVLYGTGLRHANALTATAAGTALPILFWGAQGVYPGLDQVNLELPRALAGAGVVTLIVTADGQAANPVTAVIR